MNLNSDSQYSLALYYQYEGEDESVVYEDFSTTKYNLPTFTLSCTKNDYDSLLIHVDYQDLNQLLDSYSLSLYDRDGNSYSGSQDGNDYTFEGLYSDTKYTAYLTYSYDAKDGKGKCRKSIQSEFSTLAYAIPGVQLKDSEISSDSIYLSYGMKNEDIGAIDSIELYKDATLISSLNKAEGSFTDLDIDTDYCVVVSFHYDLNDKKGVRKSSASFTYHTNPILDINGITSITTSEQYVAGDTISLKVKVNNPSNATVTCVVINSKECSVSQIGSYLFVDYVIGRGEFAAGENHLHVDCLTAKANGNNSKTYTYKYQTAEMNDFVFSYYSAPYVSEVETSNQLDYCSLNDPYTVDVEVGDLTNQSIKSVEMNDGTTYDVHEVVDGSVKKYQITLPTDASGIHSYEMEKVNYISGEESLSMSYEQTIQYYVLPNDTATSITTVEQFMNMESGKTYSLDADLDFSNVDYVPFAFDGIIRGNGHSIKNLRIVIPTDTTTSIRYGLFTTAKGFIDHLTLDNVYLECSLSISKNIYFGFIAGSSDECCLRNIKISDSCLMKISGSSSVYGAGLIGICQENIIVDDCEVSPLIWPASSSSNISGFIGKIYGNGSNYATFHRNVITPALGNCSSFYALSSFVRNYTVDLDDMLVEFGCASSSMYYSGSILCVSSSSRVKINHYVDLTTTKGVDGTAEKSVSIYNSCLLNSQTIPSFASATKCLDVTENCYINNSCYNGETDQVLFLEQVSNYYDSLGFNRDVWEFDDPCYTSKLSYGTPVITFNKPTMKFKK
jgi:hypothetical protein